MSNVRDDHDVEVAEDFSAPVSIDETDERT